MDPADHMDETTDGGGMRHLPKRFRFPSRYGSWLVMLLAVVAAAVGGSGTVFGVLSFLKANRLADDALKTQVASFDARRTNTFDTCVDGEHLKAELRLVLTRSGVNPKGLPISPFTGRPILAPIDGGTADGCLRESVEKVPESNRPGGPREKTP